MQHTQPNDDPTKQDPSLRSFAQAYAQQTLELEEFYDVLRAAGETRVQVSEEWLEELQDVCRLNLGNHEAAKVGIGQRC